MKLQHEIKIGILVLLALMALLWGLNYLKGKDLFSNRNRCYVVFPSVEGLVASNPVYLNGMKVGIVNRIDFTDDRSGRLYVNLLLNEDVFIPSNSIAQIYSADIIGTKALRILQGDSKEALKEGDTLRADIEPGLSQILSSQVSPVKDKAEALMVSLDSTTQIVNRLFDENTQNNVRNTVLNLSKTSASLDQMMAPGGEIQSSIKNIEKITAVLAADMSTIHRIIDNAAGISDSLAASGLATAVQSASSSLQQLNLLLESINQSKGSMGLLVNDPELYHSLDQSVKSLNVLLTDLKENPGRYVNVSVFGKKNK